MDLKKRIEKLEEAESQRKEKLNPAGVARPKLYNGKTLTVEEFYEKYKHLMMPWRLDDRSNFSTHRLPTTPTTDDE